MTINVEDNINRENNLRKYQEELEIQVNKNKSTCIAG